MQKMMYLAALGALFAAMQSGNFLVMIMAALFAYVLIEAAFTMDEGNEKKRKRKIKNELEAFRGRIR